jgi:hypothetical protein
MSANPTNPGVDLVPWHNPKNDTQETEMLKISLSNPEFSFDNSFHRKSTVPSLGKQRSRPHEIRRERELVKWTGTPQIRT